MTENDIIYELTFNEEDWKALERLAKIESGDILAAEQPDFEPIEKLVKIGLAKMERWNSLVVFSITEEGIQALENHDSQR